MGIDSTAPLYCAHCRCVFLAVACMNIDCAQVPLPREEDSRSCLSGLARECFMHCFCRIQCKPVVSRVLGVGIDSCVVMWKAAAEMHVFIQVQGLHVGPRFLPLSPHLQPPPPVKPVNKRKTTKRKKEENTKAYSKTHTQKPVLDSRGYFIIKE